MNTKLTLTLDNELIEKAKQHAKKNGSSLSGMVENYFKILTNKEEKKKIEITPFINSIPLKGKVKLSKNFEITPLVKSLKTGVKLPKDFDYKEALTEALSEKYGL